MLGRLWNKLSSGTQDAIATEDLDVCLNQINDLKKSIENLSDKEIRDRFSTLSKKVINKEASLESVTNEALALTREAAKRVLGMFHYDTQIIAGLILSKCAIAEIATGEGKTLITSLPAVVHALKGKGVHIVTTNAYLAKRDYETTSPLYEFLGLTTDYVDQDDTPQQKHIKYQKDIVFGTGYQFGFDYLREQLRLLSKPKAAPGLAFKSTLLGQAKKDKNDFYTHKFADFVIIDEVDSVLLDEAHMPLVISGSSKEQHAHPEFFKEAKRIAAMLSEDDYKINSQKTGITLTNKAQEKIYSASQSLNLKGLKRPFHLYVLNALKAEKIFSIDVQYVVEDGEIAIVDQNTGRRFKERTWKDGLHQAVQAKENIKITEEGQSMASITRQRYFNFYDNMSGMSGTVAENRKEFKECYNLLFQKVPLFKPSKQEYYPTRIFDSCDHMLEMLIKSIKEIHKTGRPILIGTRSISASEQVSEKLKEHNLTHKLLNAKQDRNEAQIIQAAGQRNAITIATNMAGRGTHIDIPDEIINLGGLHVIAVERNESARIDRQLTGRTARQGQPGSAQFFLSAEDHILVNHCPKLARVLLKKTVNNNGEFNENLTSTFDEVQRRIQKEHYYHRQHLMKHDDWLETVKNKL